MATFDGWEEQLYRHRLPNGPDTLCHFRTKGSKNGVRRYQLEDGTWTPLGLRERKAREGWGDREKRREAKRQAKADRKAQRAARIEAYREERRKANPKYMTDDELRNRIGRLKMEQEYRELARSPLLEAGKKLINAYMSYKADKEQREIDRVKQALEMKRLEVQGKQATEATKKAKYEAESAKAEAKKKARDVRGGLKYERKAQLTNAKTNFRGTTLLGAIGKRVNNRAKYIQENRMNAIDAKKAARTANQTKLVNERESQLTEREKWKAYQEWYKSRKGKN